ncbi:MAG: YheC/YheD family protein [Heliobacteriaceae bacterium]|nr:YheC/YheD family protein [Heliobacteriaceae bacterium]
MIVGVLVHPAVKPDRFRGNRLFFRQLAEQGEGIGVKIAIFSPQQINWPRRRVRAYVYRGVTGRWVMQGLPLPGVVYDRYFSIGNQPANIFACRKTLAKRGVPRFNPAIGTKYQIYRQLARDPETARYLPETLLFNRGKDLSRKLAVWQRAYLKPVTGMKGKGIIRLSPRANNLVYLEQVNRKNGRLLTTEGAVKSVRSLIRGRRYLLQQGIEPATWEGKIFDLRILAQKDRQGQWQITGGAARVTANGITCNLHTGAQAVSLETVLTAQGGVKPADVYAVASLIAQSLGKANRGLGELGLDFLVDTQGRLWFLEANPRPGRIVFHRIGDLATRLLAVRRPLEYAQYLAGKRKAR